MHRWMAAFPNPTNPDRDEDEVIYEDWGEDFSDTTFFFFVCVLHNHSFLRLCVCVRLPSGAVCGAVRCPAGRRAHPGAH